MVFSPITEIWLHNFRSHKDLRLPLSSGLTFIVADNHVGKTNVLRAMRWFMLAEGAAKEVTTIGCTWVEVGVVLADGTRIWRRADKLTNSYFLQPAGEPTPTEYKKVGTTVPQDVSAALGISAGSAQWSPHWQGVDDVPPTQLQPQLLASLFSGTVGVDWVERCIKEVGSAYRRLSTQVTALHGPLNQAKADLEALPSDSEIAEALEALSALEERYTAQVNTVSEVTRMALAWKGIQLLKAGADKISRVAGLVGKYEMGVTDYKQKRDGIAKLQYLFGQWSNNSAQRCNIEAEVAKLQEQIGLVEVCPTCGQELPTY